MTNKTYIFKFLVAVIACFTLFCVPTEAADDKGSAFRATPYPLPRFVSLRSDEVYVRSGPGTKYPVKWVFKKKGLPVEVILEYEVWRKIRDYQGDEGWVHQSLISGARTGLVLAHGEPGDQPEPIPFFSDPEQGARLVAQAEPRVVGDISECRDRYCRMEASGYKGWVPQEFIWGVYPDEVFD